MNENNEHASSNKKRGKWNKKRGKGNKMNENNEPESSNKNRWIEYAIILILVCGIMYLVTSQTGYKSIAKGGVGNSKLFNAMGAMKR